MGWKEMLGLKRPGLPKGVVGITMDDKGNLVLIEKVTNKKGVSGETQSGKKEKKKED